MVSRVLALAVVIAGCEHDLASPSPPQPPGPTPDLRGPAPSPRPVTSRRRIRPRDDLEGWMLPLPKHGLMTAQMGLGARGPLERRVIVDLDARTLKATTWDDPPKQTSKALSKAELDELSALTEAAWTVSPPADHPVSDYREVVVAVDGDDAMMLSFNGPIPPSPAADLADKLRGAAGW